MQNDTNKCEDALKMMLGCELQQARKITKESAQKRPGQLKQSYIWNTKTSGIW